MGAGGSCYRSIEQAQDALEKLSHVELDVTQGKSQVEAIMALRDANKSLEQWPHWSDVVAWTSMADLHSVYGLAFDKVAHHNSNVTKVNLRAKHLTTIPDSFTQLKYLSWLYLPNNRLASLPDSFGHLKHLKRLDLFSTTR